MVPEREATPRPVFVVGAMRSGTTLLRLMLNEHPDLALPAESHFLAPLLRDFGPRALLGKLRLWSGDLDRATELLQAALSDAVSSRNERLRSYRLYDLALVNCAAGELQAADELARQGLESAQDAEDRHVEGWLLYPVALVHAWLGRADEERTGQAYADELVAARALL